MLLVMLQVMDSHPFCNILLKRSWIHTVGVVTSPLHQRLKYIMNRKLVNVKAKETVYTVRNMVVPFIKAEDYKDGNIHALKIMNTDWVPKNTMLRRPKTSETTRMVFKCFLECGVPF